MRNNRHTPQPRGAAAPRNSRGSYRLARAAILIASALLAAAHGLCFAESEYTRMRYEHSKVVTLNPFPIEVGQVQIELGYFNITSSARWTNSWRRTSRRSLAENSASILVAAGWAKNIDIGLQIGYADLTDSTTAQKRGSGLTDIELSSAYLIYYRDVPADVFAVGYLGTITFPTGKEADIDELGISAEFFTFDNRFSIVKDLPSYWTINFDLGYTWFFGPDAKDSRGVVSGHAAIGRQLTNWLQPTLEFGYQREFVKGRDAQRASVATGVVMPLSGVTRLVIGVQQDVAGCNADQLTTIIANVSFTF